MLRLLRRSQPPATPVPAEDPAAEDELVAPAPPVPSTPPAPPLAGGATYVDRYRGTEWDTGFAVDRRGPDAVSALVGLLTGAIAFAALVTLWILLGSPVPS